MTSRVGCDVQADLLGKLGLGKAALLTELGQVFGETHGPVVVNRHDYSVSLHRDSQIYPLMKYRICAIYVLAHVPVNTS